MAEAATRKPAIKGIHHAAFRCRDAEQTRYFYEDVMGLNLAAALDLEMGRVNPKPFGSAPKEMPFPFMHLFFEMGDGRYIAFFDVPGDVKEEYFDMQWGLDRHVAFEVESEVEQSEIRKRWEEYGCEVWGPTDHEFVKSIYTFDPNGIAIEVTYRVPEHDAVMAREASAGVSNIDNWTEETAEQKAALRL